MSDACNIPWRFPWSSEEPFSEDMEIDLVVKTPDTEHDEFQADDLFEEYQELVQSSSGSLDGPQLGTIEPGTPPANDSASSACLEFDAAATPSIKGHDTADSENQTESQTSGDTIRVVEDLTESIATYSNPPDTPEERFNRGKEKGAYGIPLEIINNVLSFVRADPYNPDNLGRTFMDVLRTRYHSWQIRWLPRTRHDGNYPLEYDYREDKSPLVDDWTSLWNVKSPTADQGTHFETFVEKGGYWMNDFTCRANRFKIYDRKGDTFLISKIKSLYRADHVPCYDSSLSSFISQTLGQEPNTRHDLRDRNGESALFLATKFGQPQVVLCLLKAGADYRIENYAGKMLLAAAREELLFLRKLKVPHRILKEADIMVCMILILNHALGVPISNGIQFRTIEDEKAILKNYAQNNEIWAGS
ncbi:hypothetical protein NA57DRAFT_81701 [Rhizodiscina lignyota]|uniref:Ankyrin n=1 Tax=Rhizodiscina lignyota TaxID=1504668 RepID=A0A9P4I131_9PEZI|nr:hypothetical protein NA57DRAFT_81701 [Rhizodiscina lignyota]